LPDPLVRVKRNVSVLSHELIPVDPDTYATRDAWELEKIETSELLQGPRSLGPARDFVNLVALGNDDND
jgi:hypothetical protein